MEVRSLGFRTDLMIRRMAGSEVIDHGDYLAVRTPSNPTYWWGNFILAGTDFANADRWLETFATAFPESTHTAIGLDAEAVNDELLIGYLGAGLEPDVSTVLVASDLTEPVAASGVACRVLDGDTDWRQAFELELAGAYDQGPAHELFVERRVLEWRRLAGIGRGGWFGAFIDGQLRCSLGLLSDGAGIARYQAVATHPDFRRRGLARQLVATAGRLVLAQFDVQELVIVADPDYHATTLYRSLGFIDRDIQIQVAGSEAD